MTVYRQWIDSPLLWQRQLTRGVKKKRYQLLVYRVSRFLQVGIAWVGLSYARSRKRSLGNRRVIDFKQQFFTKNYSARAVERSLNPFRYRIYGRKDSRQFSSFVLGIVLLGPGFLEKACGNHETPFAYFYYNVPSTRTAHYLSSMA